MNQEYDQTEADAEPAASTGLATRPRDNGMAPSMLAEQQRAKSEIEAALTIAAARPRDEKRCVDGILVSCQRQALAADSQYTYSRGGTDISGASIKLMEVIAQKWGNIDFGFRELARYPGSGNRPGESVVEAFAWDLETNTRRKVQFTVQHVREKKSGNTPLTDPRDIYEMIANQAQRRVRTCLENIIPRDIVDTACGECDKTLKASVQDVPKAAAALVAAFAGIGVTKEQIEARIQRRIDAITPAQIIGLRKIGASIKDGISEAADWFTTNQPEKGGRATESKLNKPKVEKSKEQQQPAGATQDGESPPAEPEENSVVEGATAEQEGRPEPGPGEKEPLDSAAFDGLCKAIWKATSAEIDEMQVRVFAQYAFTDPQAETVNAGFRGRRTQLEGQRQAKSKPKQQSAV